MLFTLRIVRRACRFFGAGGAGAPVVAGAPMVAGAGSAALPTATLPRPEMPAADECCGNGCEECVFTEYTSQLRAWEAATRAAAAAEAGSDAGRSQPACGAG